MKYPNFSQEKELAKLGYKTIAGIDEAGRGAWAGPVVAAAVVISEKFDVKGVKDSKLVLAKKREELFEAITKSADFGVGIMENEIIDELGILNATRVAMREALEDLKCSPDFALIDAVRIGNLSCRQRYIIRGDRKVMSIAAASIVAKVTRDRILLKLHKNFPQYCFDKHKGYGTRLHQEMIMKHGPCGLHRKSYAPIARILNKQLKV